MPCDSRRIESHGYPGRQNAIPELVILHSVAPKRLVEAAYGPKQARGPAHVRQCEVVEAFDDTEVAQIVPSARPPRGNLLAGATRRIGVASGVAELLPRPGLDHRRGTI